MKNFLALLLILVVTITLTKAQSNADCKKNEDFLIKVQKFRYTLYADLMPRKERIMSYVDSVFSDTTSVIYNKTKKFYNDNYNDIKDFQKYDLGKYSATEIDFSNYKIDSTFNLIISDPLIFSYYSTYLTSYCFLTYSPISYAFTINSILLARVRTPSEIGNSSILNNFASALIKTKLLQDNVWEIVIDNYEYIFVHEFNLLDNKIIVTKVYKRV